MTLIRLFEFVTGKSWRQKPALQSIPPTIAKAVERVIKHFEADAEGSYKQTALHLRIDHVYRDIRCLQAWLAERCPSDDGSNYSATLPSLGDVILTITGSRLVPRCQLDQVLDAHFMHHWDDPKDVAVVEGRYSRQRDVTGHGGTVETCHYLPVPRTDQMIKAEVETMITVTTTVSADLVNRPVTTDARAYIHDSEPQEGRPLSLEWEEWM